MSSVPPRPIEILSVEDSAGDRWLIEHFISKAALACNVTFVTNGEEALAYLRKQGKYAEAETPDLVLLDLNIPRVVGLEVLKGIKNDPRLKTIPTLIFSSSTLPSDIQKTYELNANCFYVKPFEVESFGELIKVIEHHWVESAMLPPKKRA
jgi:CheY-like chemotaxis protein